MSETLKRNELVLKIEYHLQMANACKEDATSLSNHILSPEDHQKAQNLTQESSAKDALRKAASYHQEKAEHYMKEFRAAFPDQDASEIYAKREDWMVDEIWAKAALLEDPVLLAKEDNAHRVR